MNPPSTDPAVQNVTRALRDAQINGVIREEMPGGASTRRFFRIDQNDGPSLVAMFVPAPSQEIAKARQVAGSGAFVEVQALLSQAGVNVPKIISESEACHVLLVEDLGDDTLANYLLRSEGEREGLYRTAVRDLAHAQVALVALPEDSSVRTRAFDHDLLRWEVEHFREWALIARGLHLTPSDQEVFETAAEYLSTTIASWPRGFVHRDYQSRNLMVRSEANALSITWIDFQDAMLGPRAYDLVALLTDSYQTFTREFIEARLDEFAEARGIEGERATLGFEFDFITVQRKLKDAGRFVFIDRVNGNSSFLKYVDPTIEKARGALSRLSGHPPLDALTEMLDRVLPRTPE